MFRFLFLRERKSYRTHISRHGEYYRTKHKLSPCLCFKILGKKSVECVFFSLTQVLGSSAQSLFSIK